MPSYFLKILAEKSIICNLDVYPPMKFPILLSYITYPLL
jgi:hypothetical protein